MNFLMNLKRSRRFIILSLFVLYFGVAVLVAMYGEIVPLEELPFNSQ